MIQDQIRAAQESNWEVSQEKKDETRTVLKQAKQKLKIAEEKVKDAASKGKEGAKELFSKMMSSENDEKEAEVKDNEAQSIHLSGRDAYGKSGMPCLRPEEVSTSWIHDIGEEEHHKDDLVEDSKFPERHLTEDPENPKSGDKCNGFFGKIKCLIKKGVNAVKKGIKDVHGTVKKAAAHVSNKVKGIGKKVKAAFSLLEIEKRRRRRRRKGGSWKAWTK